MSSEVSLRAEVEWGRTYTYQRKQGRRASIGPTGSPIDLRKLWENYQRTKQLTELRMLKKQIASKPPPRMLKNTKKTLDPDTVSKKKYYSYMATPKVRYELPPPRRPKQRRGRVCSPRLLYLALPSKKRVFYTWKDYEQSLPMEVIIRFRDMLQNQHSLDPKFARCYFKTLDKKKRKLRRQLRRRLRKRKKAMRKREGEWLKNQIKATVEPLVKFLKQEPLFALNFKQMMLSDAILDKLKHAGYIRKKPSRNTNKSCARAIVDIVDQLSVWVDTIVRYVDLQYTEDMEELLEVESLESLFGEEEEEGEEGEEVIPKRYTLPPLPPLPEMPPLEIAEAGDFTEVEDISGIGGLDRAAALEAALSKVVKEGGVRKLSGDALEVLITILSQSPPEMLREEINPQSLPGVTYGNILMRLKNLHNAAMAAEKASRQEALAEALIGWARSNDPDSVDEKVLKKIQDAAGILSECLAKEALAGLEEEVLGAAGLGQAEENIDDVSVGYGTTDYDDLTSAGGEGGRSTAGGEGSRSAAGAPSTSGASVGGEGSVTGKSMASSRGRGEEAGSTALSVTEKSVTSSRGRGEEAGSTALSVTGGKSTGLPSSISSRGAEGGATTISEFGEGESTKGLGTLMEERESQLASTSERLTEGGEGAITELEAFALEKEMAKAKGQVPGAPGAPGAVPGVSGVKAPGKSGMGVLPGHAPSKVFEHQPDTICCLTLKIWATWLLEVAHNAHAWSKWLNSIIGEVRRIAAILRGEVKDENGEVMQYYREDWIEFTERVDNMITSWRQYSMHVKDLTDKIVGDLQGKTVTCCPKCLEDNMIVDVVLAHNITQQLSEAMQTAGYWRRWLDDIVMETRRLTGAALDTGSLTGSYGTTEIVEMYEAHVTESEESIYEIEEFED